MLVKTQIEMPDALKARLDDVALKRKLKRSAIIAEALRTQQVIDNLTQAGAAIIARHPDGREEVVAPPQAVAMRADELTERDFDVLYKRAQEMQAEQEEAPPRKIPMGKRAGE